MKVVFFSTKSYDRIFFSEGNREFGFDLHFLDTDLCLDTAPLAEGADAVCVFVNDVLDGATLEALAKVGVRLIVLRCAGFNNVDLAAAQALGMRVGRVPAYSPYAVAEHAVALILALNRKVHRAFNRVRESNFSLDGLMGFDLRGTTVGVIGTGKIGRVFVGIMRGFGCEVLAYDPFPNEEAVELGARYVDLEELYGKASIVSLHCPLSPESYHMINEEAIGRMRDGVMLINTSRGALVDTAALIQGLKSRKVGHVGLDVYEEEADLFFEDLSTQVMQDDIFARLTTFPNVIVTGHQAFLTSNALGNIAQTTLGNLKAFADGTTCPNELFV